MIFKTVSPALAGGLALLLRLEPKIRNKFPILTALAKALRNKSDFIFWLKPILRTGDLRLKPEAIHVGRGQAHESAEAADNLLICESGSQFMNPESPIHQRNAAQTNKKGRLFRRPFAFRGTNYYRLFRVCSRTALAFARAASSANCFAWGISSIAFFN